jgi:hypothetical protein
MAAILYARRVGTSKHREGTVHKKSLSNPGLIGYKAVMDVRVWGTVAQFISAAGTVTIATTAIVAASRYRYQVSLERMKWLQQLYDNFYNSERYKEIRQLIDFDDLGTLVQLLKRSDAAPREVRPAERGQIDQFTDYLNFFEWIGYLEKERQLTIKHIDTMFKYYLVRLMQVDGHQELRQYIKGHGYEELHRLLNHYSKMGD